MATATLKRIPTMADALALIGDIPPHRILIDPRPGAATEADVLRLEAAADQRRCELVNGVLVEKTMGVSQSLLAAWLIELLAPFARRHNLGLVLADGLLMRMIAGNIRVPDVSFVSWDQLPDRRVPASDPITNFAPALAIEVLSPSNTTREMREKREEYFASGSQLVWEFNPEIRAVRVYTAPRESILLTDVDTLTGGDVLPGFAVAVRDVFGELDRRG